jgi:diaminopimelate decarboxylase/aspartate kinase
MSIQIYDSEGRFAVPKPGVVSNAEVMACGELLSTRLGTQWLERNGFSVAWRDARRMLQAEPGMPGLTDHQRFLLATCDTERDDSLCGQIDDVDEHSVVVTQGFLAGDEQGRTVLLGRGGSDTSAAIFAAKIDAARLEIWTDVPGMFTANPHEIPAARLLNSLSYDEAETLAGMGAKVLHPHCIEPVRRTGVPLHIRWIKNPEVPGTVIEAALTDHANGLKAVAARDSLCLITMERNAGWQPIGFLADVCSIFKKHALSIDLLASSSSNIRITIDLADNVIREEKMEPLVSDLKKVCRTMVHDNAASVCLIGHEIRATIHRLGPTLAVLEEQNLLMLTQAANDLTFSFVVPGDRMKPLLTSLHETLFEQSLDDEHFGPTWAELQNLTNDSRHKTLTRTKKTIEPPFTILSRCHA